MIENTYIPNDMLKGKDPYMQLYDLAADAIKKHKKKYKFQMKVIANGQ